MSESWSCPSKIAKPGNVRPCGSFGSSYIVISEVLITHYCVHGAGAGNSESRSLQNMRGGVDRSDVIRCGHAPYCEYRVDN
jgi:hypothetical protein